jgi:hypothetical protein
MAAFLGSKKGIRVYMKFQSVSVQLGGRYFGLGGSVLALLLITALVGAHAQNFSSQSCPCSLWNTSTVPGNVDGNDPNGVELGVRFTSDVAGYIIGIRFYKGSTNTGTHIGNLWTNDGTLLATATFSNETASGWQQVNFGTPVAIAANTTYVASYYAPAGNYSYDENYFASAFTNTPLHAMQDGSAGSNGVFLYGAASGFPTETYLSTNYYVDVVFTTPIPHKLWSVIYTDSQQITAGQMTVTSNVPEDPVYSIAAGYQASNLIDGNPNTLAYPGSRHLDYQISLGQLTQLSSALINWGYFGRNSSYVGSWSLLARSAANQPWFALAQGGFPNSATTLVNLDFAATDLRLVADSTSNWIGIYELTIDGRSVVFADVLHTGTGQITVTSNVPEDPVYSIARGYQASKLIDGNPDTLAYPGSRHLDYQVSLGQLTPLSSALINWGQYGSDSIYVSSWSLLARRAANQPWITLAQGGFPNSTTTLVKLDFAATDLRVVADSTNWIGIYELDLTGIPAGCINGAAVNAIDGNPNTMWVTQYCGSTPAMPHEIQIDLGAYYNLSGFQYLPRQDGSACGWVSQYELYLSSDGFNWGTPVAAGTFDYSGYAAKCPGPGAGVPPPQQIGFATATARYIRLRALSEVNGNPWATAAELNVLGGINTTYGTQIQLENNKPGDSSWQITNWAVDLKSGIEGFASAASINRGESISFFVNTADPSFTMDIFRMGWYGGAGARRMMPTITVPGTQQPAPLYDPITRLVECQWNNPYVLQIPANPSDPTDWLSGVYLVKLTGTVSGSQSYIIFVVRDDARSSDLLFQSSVPTYQAYNDWGGLSLYTNPQAYKVSFNRPYNQRAGTGDFFEWEYFMLRFLEREGYDVTYTTDVDTHTNGSLILQHKAFLSVGHDEYWSWQMRDSVEKALETGINLAFFGANAAYWQVRFEPSPVTGVPNRTIVCYKSAALDPFSNDGNPSDQQLVTTRFRDPPVNRPENLMIGIMYQPDCCDQGDMVIADASDWIFANTGLRNGDQLTGLLGYEADMLFPNPPSGTKVIAHSPYTYNGTTRFSDMAEYMTSAGSMVVATGSMQWNWGLDDFPSPWAPGSTKITSCCHPVLVNPAVQQATRNILHRFGANPGPPLP